MVTLSWWNLVLIIYAWGLLIFILASIDSLKIFPELSAIKKLYTFIVILFYPLTLVAVIVIDIKTERKRKRKLKRLSQEN